MESSGDVNLLPSYEVWKWIPKYEGRYEVSNRGNVRTWVGNTGVQSVYGRFLTNPINRKQYINSKGYLSVGLGCVEKRNRKIVRVHRLVALAFVPNINNFPEANHLNGIKKCNEWWNFEWTDHFGNLNHAFETGLIKLCLGQDQGKTKLSNEQVLNIFTSKELKTKLAKENNVSLDCIWSIQSGRTWSHLTKAKRYFKPSERGKYKKESYN